MRRPAASSRPVSTSTRWTGPPVGARTVSDAPPSAWRAATSWDRAAMLTHRVYAAVLGREFPADNAGKQPCAA